MKRKNWIRLTAALAAMMLALTACGGTPENQEKPAGNNGTATEAPGTETPETQGFDPSGLDGAWTMDFYFQDGDLMFSYPAQLDAGQGTAEITLLSGDILQFQYTPEEERMTLNVSLDDGEIICAGAYEAQDGHIALRMDNYVNPRETGFEERPKIFWDSYNHRYSNTEVILSEASGFTEGVAWITVGERIIDSEYHTLGARQTMLINREGQVLYAFPQEESHGGMFDSTIPSTTPFVNGVSFVDTGTDQMIINTAGEVVWSVSENGWAEAERIFGEGAVEEITMSTGVHKSLYVSTLGFTGYSVVEMSVNTFELTEDLCGILKPDGTWLIEPSAHEEGRLYNVSMYSNRIYANLEFCQDNHADGDYTYKAINLETGEICEIQSTRYSPSDYYEALFDGSTDSDVYIGSLTPLRWQADRDRRLQDGLLYLKYRKAFVDTEGNVVIDLSKYTYAEHFDWDFYPIFRDGYCFLSIENPSGASYITVIDTSGNEVFPPVKAPGQDSACNSIIGDGMFRVMGQIAPEDSPCYVWDLASTFCYDLQGNLHTVEGAIRCTGFSDGLQLVQRQNGQFGPVDYQYLDVNGVDPFPQ